MPVDYSVSSAVVKITLNRPEKRNALDDSMIAGLEHALVRSMVEKSARVVLISGKGNDFCAGMDLHQLQETSDQSVEKNLESAGVLGGFYRALRRHRFPVVAAVQGRALGGGCGLANACDVVLAAESAEFGYPEVNIGFVPAIVMSMLRRSVGEKRAFDLLVSGKPVSAQEALEMGLVTKVLPDARFQASVDTYLANLTEKPATAVALTKKLFYETDGMSFEAAIENGVRMNALARMTTDAKAGFKRFAKKKD
jgi:methylglutaconyl-CoA hydratase